VLAGLAQLGLDATARPETLAPEQFARLLRWAVGCEIIHNMRKISESAVRRLSVYLRFLEQFDAQGHATVSSAELARRGATTSAQVRKDLSFFGSFGKRGLGYSVPELTARLREILGLKRNHRVVLVGAGDRGRAGSVPGFRQRASMSGDL